MPEILSRFEPFRIPPPHRRRRLLRLQTGIPGYRSAGNHGAQLNAIANGISQWPTGDQFPAVGIPSLP